jgi:hypothetical protein
MDPISWQFMSYDYQNLDRSIETEIWEYHTSRFNSRFWQNLAMTFPGTVNMKNSVNKLSFPQVMHKLSLVAKGF